MSQTTKRQVERAFFKYTAPSGRVVSAMVKGRELETLKALIASPAGVDVLSFPGGPAYRLAAYVHRLRALGLLIETEAVPHRDGWHARYVLQGSAEFLDGHNARLAAPRKAG
jgi:hypothetical protein